jgi:hypothetical protein
LRYKKLLQVKKLFEVQKITSGKKFQVQFFEVKRIALSGTINAF